MSEKESPAGAGDSGGAEDMGEAASHPDQDDSRAAPSCQAGGGWFRVANRLFDVVMPKVSAPAWKIQCTIARATEGWTASDGGDPSKRKKWDALSYTQLRERTGLGSNSTVKRALGELLEAGYLVRRVARTYAGADIEVYEYSLSRGLRLDGLPSTGSVLEPSTETVLDEYRNCTGTEYTSCSTGSVDTKEHPEKTSIKETDQIQIRKELSSKVLLERAAPPSLSLPSGIPDPSRMTVRAIAKVDLDKDGWRELGEVEAQGKNRAGVKEIVERKLRAAVPAIEVFREITEMYPLKALWPDIVMAVGDEPDDLELWDQVVKGWCGMGYKKTNVAGMLECYARREIPTSSGGRAARGAAMSPIKQYVAGVQARATQSRLAKIVAGRRRYIEGEFGDLIQS